MGDFNSLIKQVIDKTNYAQLKRVTGKIISVESKSRATVKITGTETELSLVNKTGEKLSVGDNVHVHYWGNITSGYIAIRNGNVKPLGVGEDLGNGNERFNDYDNNIVKNINDAYNNSLRNQNNTIIKGDNNDISGSGNRVMGYNNKVEGTNNKVFAYSGENNVSGTDNQVKSSKAMVSGTGNVVGIIPTTSGTGSLYDTYYKDTENETNGVVPTFYQSALPGTYYHSIAEGLGEIVNGSDNVAWNQSTVCGQNCIAGDTSIVEGTESAALFYSSAFGEKCLALTHSFAAGQNCSAGTQVSYNNTGSGAYNKINAIIGAGTGKSKCFAFGKDVIVYADNAGAIGEGLYNREDKSFVCGTYNAISQSGNILFYVGNGSGEGSRSNAFEVHKDGNVYASGAYNAMGADYAELFQWDPSVPMEQRNKTRFLSTKGKFITPAESGDYVVGVISHNYNFLGNQELLKEVDVDDVGTVGLLGQVIVEDDGSCKIDGFCKPSRNGIGTASDGIVEYNLKTNTIQYCYRVIERIDENHVKIILK